MRRSGNQPCIRRTSDSPVKLEQDRLTAWQQVQSTHVSAHTVLGGDISNGLHEIADVDDLILSPDGQRVQYVLFDLRGPFDTIDGRNGFADWTTLDVDNGTLGDVELVLSNQSTAKGAANWR